MVIIPAKSAIFAAVYREVISLVKLRRFLAISFIYTKMKRGPRTDHFGMPAKIDFKPEKHDDFKQSFCFLWSK